MSNPKTYSFYNGHGLQALRVDENGFIDAWDATERAIEDRIASADLESDAWYLCKESTLRTIVYPDSV